MINSLTTALQPLALALSANQQQQLLIYLDQLEKWNKAYNLTAIRDRHKMISHHIVDSLMLLPYLTGASLIDIGTGAGLPGIPLAITRPALSVNLLDSNGKKCRFLTHIRQVLQLNNTQIFHQRVEQHNNQYDLVTARAVASLRQLWQWAQPLLSPNGKLLAMKGQLPQAEISDLHRHHSVDVEVHPLTLLAQDPAKRHVVAISAQTTVSD